MTEILDVHPHYEKKAKQQRQHYFHFLLGVLLPLINWHRNNNDSVVVETCKIFDKHIHALQIPNLTIVKDIDNPTKIIRGYDTNGITPYPVTSIKSASNWLVERAQSRLPYKILIINRGKPDDFYKSSEYDPVVVGKNSAGNERRSIPNFADLCSKLSYLNPKIVELEECDLFTQVSLFNAADIIIAQHGASLTNLIFCKPETVVIEIRSNFQDKKDHQGKAYEKLSHAMGLMKHIRIKKDSEHSPINIDSVMDAVKYALITLL